MGKSNIVPLVIRKANSKEFLSYWSIALYGRPTEANLSKWRDGFNVSLLKGGINEHLGKNYRLQCNLEIFNQISNNILCTYNSPMFEII